jgi:ribosome-binding factor A
MSRQDKVAEAIRQEISIIIHDELNDPRVGFVTITKVELTHDLSYAKVFFSVLGGEEDYRKTKDALNSALGFIRKLVAERINLRLAPEIAFQEDKNIEYSIHVQKLLDEIRGQDEPKKGSRVHKKKQ